MTASGGRPSIVIVGAGFAGYYAARELIAHVGTRADIVVINSTDYFLYLPLMPQVAGGLLEPRHLCTSLQRRLRGARFVLGTVQHIDARDRQVVSWVSPEGESGECHYDRLILTVGSVNKLLPIPGLAEHAHGFRSIGEATYLRDHIIRQLELAQVAADPAEREARCTFVVVGAGYTGTEVTAQGQLLTTRLRRRMPDLARQEIRWMLLDTAPRVLPDLDPRLSKTADRVLRRRGVEVRTGQSVTEAMADVVQLSTGEKVSTRSLIWCVGVRADPLVDDIDLETMKGRLVVDEYMAVPGATDMYACGDCAAVPDVTRPGQVCGMTAQHAERQGKQVARNVAASLGIGTARRYEHHDLGFLVDLGGTAAAINPLHIPLSGPLANVITRGYHVWVMSGNRMRVLTDWTLNAVTPPEVISFGTPSVPLDVNKPSS
jgi:NADH:ubiquinone reductase (H+-translocating)